MADTCKTLTIEKTVQEPNIKITDFGFADTSTSQSGFIYNDSCKIDLNNYEGKPEGVGVVIDLIEMGDPTNIDKFEITAEYDRPNGDHVTLKREWYNSIGTYNFFLQNPDDTWIAGQYSNLNVSIEKIGTVF